MGLVSARDAQRFIEFGRTVKAKFGSPLTKVSMSKACDEMKISSASVFVH